MTTVPGRAPDLEAAAAILGSAATADVPLGPFCTYRVGGPAALFVEPDSITDLEPIRAAVVATGCPTLVVGRGSNLLVAEAGFPGIAIHLGPSFEAVEIDEETATVRAGGAALLPVVARRSASAGLTGFEWAVGVPGSIGGAVRMNAGGHGSDMAANLVTATVFDLAADIGAEDGTDTEPALADWPLDRLALGYRRSAIGPRHLVLSAELALSQGDAERSTAQISEIVAWRRANQPGGQNAGSVFANPEGDSAGRLIDTLGLKGFRVGSAEVSTKHANFIQVDPDGSADDVVALIREIRVRVAAASGIELQVENRLIGFDEQATR